MPPHRPIPLEALLPSVPLLDGVGAETLAQGAAEVRLAKHDRLFEAGSPCDSFHLVIHGQLKLPCQLAQDNEKIVEILGPGQTFGETLMFSERPYMVSAHALTDSCVVQVPKQAILIELEADSQLRLRLLTLMSSRLHELMSHRHCETQQSGTQRFIGYLLRLLPHPTHAGGDVLVKLPTTKRNISSLLNLTKEHLSRILRALSERGLIAVSGCRIHIPDVALLAGYRDSQFIAQPIQAKACANRL